MSKPSHSRCEVAYERPSGRILHVHFMVTVPGGVQRTDEAVRDMVTQHAVLASGLPVKEIAVLSTTASAFLKDRRYKIAPKTEELVAVQGSDPGFSCAANL